jgi:hypothetical protein
LSEAVGWKAGDAALRGSLRLRLNGCRRTIES